MNGAKNETPGPEESLPSLEEMVDIIDIEGVLDHPYHDLWVLLIFFVAAIILSAGLFVLIRIIKRRRQGRHKTLTPHGLAEWELARLGDVRLISFGDYAAYYHRLSEILRRYLQERFSYPAIDQTTPEIVKGLSERSEFAENHRKEVSNFLFFADSVRFARQETSREKAMGDRERILAFVLVTRSL